MILPFNIWQSNESEPILSNQYVYAFSLPSLHQYQREWKVIFAPADQSASTSYICNLPIAVYHIRQHWKSLSSEKKKTDVAAATATPTVRLWVIYINISHRRWARAHGGNLTSRLGFARHHHWHHYLNDHHHHHRRRHDHLLSWGRHCHLEYPPKPVKHNTAVHVRMCMCGYMVYIYALSASISLFAAAAAAEERRQHRLSRPTFTSTGFIGSLLCMCVCVYVRRLCSLCTRMEGIYHNSSIALSLDAIRHY